MLRTLRTSRSLPSLRSAAVAHAAQPVPTIPVEFCLNANRSMATTTTRTRKPKTMVPAEPSTLLAEPKKRGRPRKNSLAPVVLRRSNSTDAKPAADKKSKKGDPVPTIPQPSKSANTGPVEGKIKKPAKGESNVPTAADQYQEQKPAPKATSHMSEISTAQPGDVGSRVQAVSEDLTKGAEKFAVEAVQAIDSAKGFNVDGLQKLLNETASKLSTSTQGSNGKDQHEGRHQSKDEQIPQGEKTVLLSMLGLTGAWLVFGGKLQKKGGSKQ